MRVPSTQALRALDAFARLGSVWQAAEELSVTRSAVSHQLRLLERELGFTLLRRVGRAMTLTPRGRRYAQDVRKALTAIGDAAVRQDDRGVAGPLTVSCTAGFASLWLCPLIGSFRQRYSDIALRIVTPRQLAEVSNPEADLFIAFGDGHWPGRRVELLSEVKFTPLCSPMLLNQAGGFSAPADLLRVPLLHLVDAEDWIRWFALAGVEQPDPDAGIVFSDLNLVLAAMTAGQGVAMGDELTCGRALAQGLIVRPFEIAINAPRAYYLVMEPQKSADPAVGAFCDWLRGELGQAEAVIRPGR
jgi:LysR family glycine cleavage system transcriptional activator